jgi:hypothetical protein
MIAILFTLAISTAALDPQSEPAGTIHGIVLNGTRGNRPCEGVDVVLRAGVDGDLVPVAETKTNRYGKFVFEQVPLEPTLVYLPGANRDGVHYPGQRVRLDRGIRVLHVTIVIFEAVTSPCPLVAKRHNVDVTVEEQALKISESLLISNPTRTTYVGQSMGSGPPVTFWLTIPRSFDRVTFDKEFFGRRFLVVDHLPITNIPWRPGEQELRFTYRVPLVESAGQFRRPLDVPSSNVCVRVHEMDQRQVSCNLPRLDTTDGPLVFASADEQIARGFAIELQITSFPFPWMQYARWGSVIVLAALASATVAIPRFRRRLSAASPRVRRQQPPVQRRAA